MCAFSLRVYQRMKECVCSSQPSYVRQNLHPVPLSYIIDAGFCYQFMCKPAQLHLLVRCPTVSHLRCPAQRVLSSSWCHFLSTLLHTLLSSLHLSSFPTCILASPLCPPPPPPLLSSQAFIFHKQMFSAPYGREFLFLSVMKSQAKFDLLKNKQPSHNSAVSKQGLYGVLLLGMVSI